MAGSKRVAMHLFCVFSNFNSAKQQYLENTLRYQILEYARLYGAGKVDNLMYGMIGYYKNKNSIVRYDADVRDYAKELAYLKDIGYVEILEVNQKWKLTPKGLSAFDAGIFRGESVTASYSILSSLLSIWGMVLGLAAIIIAIIAIVAK